MASLHDIDLSKPLSFEPTVTTPITKSGIAALAQASRGANTLKCAIPIEQGITLMPKAARAFMEWLLLSRWRPILEANLQCMAETKAGEPLLTTWLHIDRLKILVDDVKPIDMLQAVRAPLGAWINQGATNVFIDGYMCANRRASP